MVSVSGTSASVGLWEKPRRVAGNFHLFVPSFSTVLGRLSPDTFRISFERAWTAEQQLLHSNIVTISTTKPIKFQHGLSHSCDVQNSIPLFHKERLMGLQPMLTRPFCSGRIDHQLYMETGRDKAGLTKESPVQQAACDVQLAPEPTPIAVIGSQFRPTCPVTLPRKPRSARRLVTEAELACGPPYCCNSRCCRRHIGCP